MTNIKNVYRVCRQGDLKTLINIIEDNPKFDINTYNDVGETLLTIACKYKCAHTNIVKYLLDQPNIDVNKKSTTYDESPLFLACEASNYDIVKLLLQDNIIDVNLKSRIDKNIDVGSSAPLHIACNGDMVTVDVNIVKMLLEHPNIDVNIVDDQGRTPLILALYYFDIEVIKLLLEIPEIDVNVFCTDGYSIIHYLVESADCYDDNGNEDDNKINDIIKIVNTILDDHNFDITKPNKNNKTPIHEIHNCDVIKLCKTLTDRLTYKEINLRDDEGKTLFFLACEYGNCDLVELLLENDSVDVNQTDNDGMSPFHIACLGNQKGMYDDEDRIEIIQLLLETDKIVIRDIDKIPVKNTYCRNDEIIVLLEENKKVSLTNFIKAIKNATKITFATLVKNNDTEKAIEMLSDPNSDCNINEENDDYSRIWTPLCYAYKCNNLQLFELILNDPRFDVVKNNAAIVNVLNISHSSSYKSMNLLLLNDPRMDINITTNNGDRTIIHKSCYYHAEIHNGILNSDKIDYNKVDNKGKTAFFLACEIDNRHIIYKLVDKDNVDVNKCDNKGLTPFHTACLNLHVLLVKKLIKFDRIKITELPEDARIEMQTYNDDKFDKLIKVLIECERPECLKIAEQLMLHTY